MVAFWGVSEDADDDRTLGEEEGLGMDRFWSEIILELDESLLNRLNACDLVESYEWQLESFAVNPW